MPSEELRNIHWLCGTVRAKGRSRTSSGGAMAIAIAPLSLPTNISQLFRLDVSLFARLFMIFCSLLNMEFMT